VEYDSSPPTYETLASQRSPPSGAVPPYDTMGGLRSPPNSVVSTYETLTGQLSSPGACNGSVRSDEGYLSTEYHELTPPEDSSDSDMDNYVIDYR